MKLNKSLIWQWVIVLFAAIGVLGFACSCSPSFHEKKFYDKGGKFECVPITVTVYDTIKGKDGQDSLVKIFLNTPCNCPQVETPKTRWQVRFDNNRFEDSVKAFDKRLKKHEAFIIDSMRIDRQKTKIETKAETKQVKQEHKAWGFWKILIVCACLIGLALIFKGRKWNYRNT